MGVGGKGEEGGGERVAFRSEEGRMEGRRARRDVGVGKEGGRGMVTAAVIWYYVFI